MYQLQIDLHIQRSSFTVFWKWKKNREYK